MNTLAPDEAERERLIHDLEVHQTELESQNQELRETHELLEQSRSRYTDLYDFAPVAYFTFDLKGCIRELNLAAATLLGRERAYLVGRPFASAARLSEPERFRKHLATCLERKVLCTMELTLTPRGGKAVSVQLSTSPAFHPDGEVLGCRSVLTDISDRKRAEDSLRVAMRMREDFLAVVSHDLRNPLSSIVMGVELLLRNAPPKDRRHGRRQLQGIKSSAERMSRLVSDLLDLSSMDAGHLSMQRSANDAHEPVCTALEMLRPLAAEKSLRMGLNLESGQLYVSCDRERITQVLVNLLGNAIKFTPPNGTISVEVTAINRAARFAVRDSGSGIATDQLARIFEPYWQASASARGTGLGLSIARGIVEFHGGRIWAESTHGQGSTFFFTVPLASAEERAAAVRESEGRPANAVSPQAGDETLMVVDDEADMRESLAEILMTEGYHVITAKNGREALSYLRSANRRPLLILLDLVMPVMDGWEFLQTRHADPDLAQTPIVLISGQVDAHKAATSFQLAGCLDKPINVDKLLRTVREHASSLQVGAGR